MTNSIRGPLGPALEKRRNNFLFMPSQQLGKVISSIISYLHLRLWCLLISALSSNNYVVIPWYPNSSVHQMRGRDMRLKILVKKPTFITADVLLGLGRLEDRQIVVVYGGRSPTIHHVLIAG